MGLIRLGIIQMERVDDFKTGLKKIKDLASTLGRVDVAALPEMWYNGVVKPGEESMLVETGLEVASWLGGALLTGGYKAFRGQGLRVVAKIVGGNGGVVEASKRFPSHAIGERASVTPGEGPSTFELREGVRVGVVICVDAMYPELVRRTALDGALLVLNPSSLPYNRMYLWRALAQARAAENTVFYAVVNLGRGVYPDGRAIEGGSLVSSPEGRILVELGRKELTESVTLDLGEVKRVRERWVYLEDVRELLASRGTWF